MTKLSLLAAVLAAPGAAMAHGVTGAAHGGLSPAAHALAHGLPAIALLLVSLLLLRGLRRPGGGHE